MAEPGSEPQIIGGIEITHPARPVFPEAGVTKADIARYYERIWPLMSGHLKNRPVSLVRCPGGIADDCFFQKHPFEGMAGEIATLPVTEKSGETGDYLLFPGLGSLLAAVQFGTIEFHLWGARKDRLERPDRLVFDLDPGDGVTFGQVRAAAHEVAGRLEGAGLRSWPLLTGGKGIHVVVPLERRQGWEAMSAAAHGLALQMAGDAPARYVAGAAKAERAGRIFVDWLRNSRGATAICPYSLRARPGAPVAVPVSWSELERFDSASAFTPARLASRLEGPAGDPWEGPDTARQSLSKRVLRALTDGVSG